MLFFWPKTSAHSRPCGQRHCRGKETNIIHFCVHDYIPHPVLFWGTLLVAQLVEALPYKPEGRGFRSPMVSFWIFFIDIILPAALWLLG